MSSSLQPSCHSSLDPFHRRRCGVLSSLIFLLSRRLLPIAATVVADAAAAAPTTAPLFLPEQRWSLNYAARCTALFAWRKQHPRDEEQCISSLLRVLSLIDN